jgi:hypothetical protein
MKEILISNPISYSVIAWTMPPYHNVQVNPSPVLNSGKSESTSWLNKKVLPNEEEMSKPDLYQFNKINKPMHCIYRTNRLLVGHNHKIFQYSII